MRSSAVLMTAGAVALGVQLGMPAAAQPMEPGATASADVVAAAEATTVTGWWSPNPVSVHPWGVVPVQVRVRTGSGFVVRQVQVQRRRPGATVWTTVAAVWTAPDGRATVRLAAPAGVWLFRLVVPASASGAAAQTLARTVVVMRAETVSVGEQHSCGLDTYGKAWCWGSDEYGQVGDGNDNEADESAPVAVAGGHTFATISAGWATTCGIDTAGKAWCWGHDFFGNVGDGVANRASKYSPVAVAGGHTFVTISADWSTCAVDTLGTAWCWGPDGYGQVGDGSASQTPKHAPVAVAGGHTFAAISTGSRHTCGVGTGGKAWCWGYGLNGQLGDGDNPANEYVPVAVAGGRTFSVVDAGQSHTCGVDSAGAAWCWGDGEFGRLGDGREAFRNAPAAVAGSHTFKTVATGDQHSCGVDTTLKAWCWGGDEFGQVGDGPVDRSPNLVPVSVAGALAFTGIAAGRWHTCALDNSGAGSCWGSDREGQVGDGSPTHEPDFFSVYVPTAVVGDHAFRQPNW